MKRPKVYILIGVPASGKSTWIANQPFDWNNTVVASTDNYIERKAKELKSTYSDVFSDHISQATNYMLKTVMDAFENNLNVVWDQTNTSVSVRKRKLKMIPDNYIKIAVVFKTPEQNELQRRLSSRPGKNIPSDVLRRMISDFTIPTKSEGFDEIIENE